MSSALVNSVPLFLTEVVEVVQHSHVQQHCGQQGPAFTTGNSPLLNEKQSIKKCVHIISGLLQCQKFEYTL